MSTREEPERNSRMMTSRVFWSMSPCVADTVWSRSRIFSVSQSTCGTFRVRVGLAALRSRAAALPARRWLDWAVCYARAVNTPELGILSTWRAVYYLEWPSEVIV